MAEKKELKDASLEQVSGGWTDENGHVFAFAPGEIFTYPVLKGNAFKILSCFRNENGENMYKVLYGQTFLSLGIEDELSEAFIQSVCTKIF